MSIWRHGFALDWRTGGLALAFLALTSALFSWMVDVPRDTFSHVFVIDITQSMNVEDVFVENERTTRLAFAKRAARDAVQGLPCGSKAGIGIFTGHRSLLLLAPVEVCAHFTELSEMLGSIDWRMAWTAKSEVAKGVFSALDVASQLGPKTTLVFLTDGHEAPPLSADHPPRFRGTPGEVRGALAGIGGEAPAPSTPLCLASVKRPKPATEVFGHNPDHQRGVTWLGSLELTSFGKTGVPVPPTFPQQYPKPPR